jgi:dCMP deaminase
MTMIDRIDTHDMLMGIAQLIGLRGTCNRLQVGAIIVKNGRVLSSGYNGNVQGRAHCRHTERDYQCGTAVHAEANAILWSARTGQATQDTWMYTTHQPCIECAKMIVNAGITSVVYLHDYRIADGLDFLTQSNVKVFRMKEDRSLFQVTR